MQFLELSLLVRRKITKRVGAERCIIDHLIPPVLDFSSHFVVLLLRSRWTDTDCSTDVVGNNLPTGRSSYVNIAYWPWLVKYNVDKQPRRDECSRMQVCDEFGESILLLSRERDTMGNLASM